MQHVGLAEGGRHLEIDAERAQREVRLGQPGRRVVGVHAGLVARRSERVHLDIDDATQLADEELDVHSGAAVHLGGILTRQDGNPHAADPSPQCHAAR